jgi:hypothetical protein
MSRDQTEPNSPDADDPTAVLPRADAPVVPTSPPVAPPVPPASVGAASAHPEPAPKSPSRGWVIAGAAVGGVVVLGLTFGGGLATGLAIDGGQRGGPAAGQEGRGFPGPDGDRGFGDRDQPGPEQGTPPQQRDDDDDDETVTPAPTPDS